MLFVLLAAALCYGLATAIAPELPSGRRVPSSAALAPALLSLGPAGYGVAPLWALVCTGIVAHWVVVAIVRRSVVPAEPVAHTASLMLSTVMLMGIAAVSASGNLVRAGEAQLVAAVALASIPFPLCGAFLHARSGRNPAAPLLPRLREELLSLAPLAALFASMAALASLAYASLGVAAFGVLLLPLLATQHGFSRFAEARRTYHQTVRGLGKLAEAGGYVGDGHHERVAGLSVAVAREMGLWGDRVHALELVALLHDVGTLSISEPRDLADVPTRDVARAGARVLEETGYLARHARFLTAHAADPHDASPLEARILRVVNQYDELAQNTAEPLGRLRQVTAPEDRRVYEALHRVLDA